MRFLKITLILAFILLSSIGEGQVAAHPSPSVHNLPPSDFFQLPFPLDSYTAFNAVHDYTTTTAAQGTMSAIDFFPPDSEWGMNTGGFHAVAAAEGLAVKDSACRVTVYHADGWMTRYYHLTAIPDFDHTPVEQNEFLGTIADSYELATCEAGFAHFPHLHFELLRNDRPVALNGLTLSGWTIHSGRFSFDDEPYYMWLQRNFALKYANEVLWNGAIDPSVFVIPDGDVDALIRAIHIANGNGVADTIYLAENGLYSILTIDNTYHDLGPNGLPPLRRDGGETTTIAGNNATLLRAGFDHFRVWMVDDHASVILQNMTIMNGTAENGGGLLNGGDLEMENAGFIANSAEQGGGIYNEGELHLEMVAVNTNTAEQGGGIYNQGGELWVMNSTIRANTGTIGGGIYNDEGETVEVSQSVVMNNHASERGSAIYTTVGAVRLNGNCILGNGDAVAVVNISAESVDAVQNWWGTERGPTLASLEGGDRVVGRVEVYPVAAAPLAWCYVE